MDIVDLNTNIIRGKINYFGIGKNDTCQDEEKCAFITFSNGTDGFENVADKYNGLRCRKNFLRYAKILKLVNVLLFWEVAI